LEDIQSLEQSGKVGEHTIAVSAQVVMKRNHLKDTQFSRERLEEHIESRKTLTVTWNGEEG